MDEFCKKGRKNKEAYRVFYKRFVPAVVGPDLYRQRVRDNNEAEPSTASDEAFALLLLENNYERWVDIYVKSKGIPIQRRGDRTKRIDSDIQPKYTRGGIKFSGDKVTNKTKGWTNEGIQRFNILYQYVRNDRLRRKGFIKRLNRKEAKYPKTKAAQAKVPAIQAAHSLWEEDKTQCADDEDDSSDDDDSSKDSAVEEG